LGLLTTVKPPASQGRYDFDLHLSEIRAYIERRLTSYKLILQDSGEQIAASNWVEQNV
jgi:hypothetical protein